jgi:hypothetical protein
MLSVMLRVGKVALTGFRLANRFYSDSKKNSVCQPLGVRTT